MAIQELESKSDSIPSGQDQIYLGCRYRVCLAPAQYHTNEKVVPVTICTLLACKNLIPSTSYVIICAKQQEEKYRKLNNAYSSYSIAQHNKRNIHSIEHNTHATSDSREFSTIWQYSAEWLYKNITGALRWIKDDQQWNCCSQCNNRELVLIVIV